MTSEFDFNYWNYNKNYKAAEQLCKRRGKNWDVATFNKSLRVIGNTIIRNGNYTSSVEQVRLINNIIIITKYF